MFMPIARNMSLNKHLITPEFHVGIPEFIRRTSQNVSEWFRWKSWVFMTWGWMIQEKPILNGAWMNEGKKWPWLIQELSLKLNCPQLASIFRCHSGGFPWIFLRVWNSLPYQLTDDFSSAYFCLNFKKHLFSKSFRHWLPCTWPVHNCDSSIFFRLAYVASSTA